jgi:parallel beta-helix repeat protein
MNASKQVLAVVCTALLALSVFAGIVSVPAGIVGAEPGVSAQSEPLNECRTIDQNGTYVLQKDLETRERSTCFRVTASDVVIDGDGNSLFGGAGTAVRVNGTDDRPVENVTIRNLRVTVLESGVTVTRARNVAISDSEFESNDGTTVVTVAEARSVTISDSEFESNDGTAIAAGDAAAGNQNATAALLVEDNVIRENERGIVLEDGANRARIIDNDIIENADAGLTVRNASRTTVRANTFSDNGGGRTLSIAGDSPHSQLVDNVIENTSGGDAVFIGERSSDAEFRDNVVRNNLRGGVTVRSDGSSLSGNVIFANDVGLRLAGSSNNVVRDNWVYNNSQWDYRSTNGSTGNAVTDLSLDTANGTVVSFDVSRDVALRGVPERDRPDPPQDFEGGDAWLNLNTTSEHGYALLNVSYNESMVDREPRSQFARYNETAGVWSTPDTVSGVNTDRNYVYGYVTESGVFAPLNGDGDLTPLAAVATIEPSPSLVGERVTLDASDSQNDDSIDRYRWDVRNDGTVDHTVDTVRRTFDSPGTYEIALTVADSATDTVVVQHVVREDTADPSPVVTNGDRTVYTGEEVAFDGSNSYDDVGITSYEWAFGDGTNATGPTATNTFTDPSGDDPYEVTLAVTDRRGNTSRTTVNVTVVDPSDDGTAPVADAGSDRHAVADRRVTLDGSGSTDDIGIERYEWDIGNDGSVDATGVTPSLRFRDTGTVPVELTVTDGGGNTDTDMVSVTVTETDTRPPVADAGPDKRLRTNQSTVFDGSGSADDSGVITSYKWDMGDGTVHYGETVTHAYSAAGTYTVTLTVTDANGFTASETTTVVVDSGPPAVTDTRVSSSATEVTVPPSNPTAVRTRYPAVREARSTVEKARADTAVRLGYDFERDADDCHTMDEVMFSTSRSGDSEVRVRHQDRNDGGLPEFDVEESGPPFGFFIVNRSQPEASVTPTSFRFSVATACLERRGVSQSDVALYRYTDNDWVRLDTTREDSPTEARVRYAANSSGLSVLAVGTTPADAGGTPTPTPSEPTPTPTPMTPTPTGPTPGEPTPTPTETTGTGGETTTPTATTPATNTSTSTVNIVGQPGLGVVAAVLALLGAALLAARRRA